jgi:hypothetical protein
VNAGGSVLDVPHKAAIRRGEPQPVCAAIFGGMAASGSVS